MIAPSVLIPAVVFYGFSAVLVMCALLVISVRNPVHAVLWLILAFFSAAGIFVMLGAEFIGMLMVIVYVGAVAVLFLFVVMMLNINFSEIKRNFARYLPIGIFVSAVMLVELVMIITVSVSNPLTLAAVEAPLALSNATNTESLGLLLYTQYVFVFQIAGLILLLAMVGAIVLTLRVRVGVRKQSIAEQMARDPKQAIEIVKVESRKGA